FLSSGRGAVSLEAIKEVVILTNGFGAEYGQASGAIFSIVSRSGSNQIAARAYYYHRDHRWDASSHAARLTAPPVEDSAFEQKLGGGFLGGPIVHDRAIFFGSAEYTMRDTENIETSPVLQLFRPVVPSPPPVRMPPVHPMV